MLNFIRSLATKSKSARNSPSPELGHISSFSPPRRRRPIVAEQEFDNLDDAVGHHDTMAQGMDYVNNTGTARILEPKIYPEKRLHEQSQKRSIDNTEKELVGGERQEEVLPVRSKTVVGLGNPAKHGKFFDTLVLLPSEQDAHEGLHERQYAEYEERVQRLREVEHRLATLTAQFHNQTRDLEEEAEDLRTEVRRLRHLVWG